MKYFKYIPDIVRPFAKDLTFDIPNTENAIYLTFDDGPHPEITPWVLDELAKYEAKATFFLTGRNAEQHPEIVELIKAQGHSIGNHGYDHLSGWKTKTDRYMEDIVQCASMVSSGLFRPPYGQITKGQCDRLKQDYRIIMWSDLSADFDEAISTRECIDHATKKIRSGSIVVFHDSSKAWNRLKKALPKCLEFYRDRGFKMASIGN